MEGQSAGGRAERGVGAPMRRSFRRTTVLVAAVVGILAACSGDEPTSVPSNSTGSPGASASSTTSAEPELPPITSVREADGQTIEATAAADWVLVASGRARG